MTDSNSVLATNKYNINLNKIRNIIMKQSDINEFIGLNKEENDFKNWNKANEVIPNRLIDGRSRTVLATDGEYWFPATYNYMIDEWESPFEFVKYPEPLVITHWTDIYCLKSHIEYTPEYHESDNFGSTRVN